MSDNLPVTMTILDQANGFAAGLAGLQLGSLQAKSAWPATTV
jgi:hypothetical protein